MLLYLNSYFFHGWCHIFILFNKNKSCNRLSAFCLWHVLCLVSQFRFNFCSGDKKTFFNSNECAETPRNVHVWNIIIGASYLFVDTFVCIAQIRNRYVSQFSINGIYQCYWEIDSNEQIDTYAPHPWISMHVQFSLSNELHGFIWVSNALA